MILINGKFLVCGRSIPMLLSIYLYAMLVGERVSSGCFGNEMSTTRDRGDASEIESQRVYSKERRRHLQ